MCQLHRWGQVSASPWEWEPPPELGDALPATTKHGAPLVGYSGGGQVQQNYYPGIDTLCAQVVGGVPSILCLRLGCPMTLPHTPCCCCCPCHLRLCSAAQFPGGVVEGLQPGLIVGLPAAITCCSAACCGCLCCLVCGIVNLECTPILCRPVLETSCVCHTLLCLV